MKKKTPVKIAKDDEFAIRCFLNGKRKPTHELTKKEALNFQAAALHLLTYLENEYKLNMVTIRARRK